MIGESEKALIEFFTFMAVCHSVVVDKDSETDQEINYQASSPDELALVKGSKDARITLLDRTKNEVFVKIGNDIEEYQILKEFPFDSTRKRMSVIVKYKDQYSLLTKGADNIMEPRI